MYCCITCLVIIFDKKFYVPTMYGADYATYYEKNMLCYSIQNSRNVYVLVLSILRNYEKTRNGRGVYSNLFHIYVGIHNLEQIKHMTMTKLSILNMNYSYQGKIPVFLKRFRKVFQDSRNDKQPYSDIIAKFMLLFNINDIS